MIFFRNYAAHFCSRVIYFSVRLYFAASTGYCFENWEKIQNEEERWVEVGTAMFEQTNYNDLLADLTYYRKTKQNKTQDCGHWLFRVFYCTCEQSCGAEARERREEKHVLVSIKTSHWIVCRGKDTYRT